MCLCHHFLRFQTGWSRVNCEVAESSGTRTVMSELEDEYLKTRMHLRTFQTNIFALFQFGEKSEFIHFFRI